MGGSDYEIALLVSLLKLQPSKNNSVHYDNLITDMQEKEFSREVINLGIRKLEHKSLIKHKRESYQDAYQLTEEGDKWLLENEGIWNPKCPSESSQDYLDDILF